MKTQTKSDVDMTLPRRGTSWVAALSPCIRDHSKFQIASLSLKTSLSAAARCTCHKAVWYCTHCPDLVVLEDKNLGVAGQSPAPEDAPHLMLTILQRADPTGDGIEFQTSATLEMQEHVHVCVKNGSGKSKTVS